MIDEIIKLFSSIEEKILNDNFQLYELKFIGQIDQKKMLEFSQEFRFKIFNWLQSFNYEWELTFEELDYSINQKDFNKELDYDEVVNESELTVHLKIFKKSNTIAIINSEVFINKLYENTLEKTLSLFSTDFSNGILFKDNSCKQSFNTTYLALNHELRLEIDDDIKLSNQCNFYNYSMLRFTPYDFYIEKTSIECNLIKYINRLNFVFILIYLFDRSDIKGDLITLKLSGFKTLEYNFTFSNLDYSSLDQYQKIFSWVYSEKHKIEDKIGIARNILSIYLKDTELNIEEAVLTSMLSAHNTYIKGSISKYIEVRNKTYEQLEQLSTKINNSLDTFYNNFQKSIFVFISFYLTIFVLKVYTKGEVTTVINKEASLMGLGLLALSVVFLLFSKYILNLEKVRIESKYSIIKKRAEDLLIKDDIDKILKDDAEFNAELNFLDKRKKLYILIWGIMLFIFFIVLFLTSEYLSFKKIIDFFFC